MFERISRTYDLLNRIFSLGVDRRWRRSAVKSLQLSERQWILDCSAGTGDMSLVAHILKPGVHTVLLDPAHSMLCIADGKAGTLPPASFLLCRGTAEALPFEDNSFDCFMVAFGIRNFGDLSAGMKELFRVLKPGGRGVILEFTPDRSPRIDKLFRTYMWRVMRPIGGLISRDKDAYAYLARTVEIFPHTPQLVALFHSIGFKSVESKPLSFGIASRFVLNK